jgi:hypothetical protein
VKHFESKDWADFVRGLAGPEAMKEMEEHAGKCEACASEVAAWATISLAMRRERNYEPPSSVVRIVKAAMAGAKPEAAPSRVRIFAQLVFDSLMQPQMAGVRGTMSGPRQLLYRAGPIVIDMRLEERAGGDRHSLVGQVLSSENSEEGMNEMPVHLLCGRSEIAKTRTNLFGEFQLEYEKAKDLQVFLELTQDKDVFIPLDESIWRTPLGA